MSNKSAVEWALPELKHLFSAPCRASDLNCQDPSLTQQQFKDDADINVLLERFKVTGVLPQGVRIPTFGDFRGVSDYQSAANAMLLASDSFMALPANIRARFGNDPHQFVEFCSDEKNLPQLREWGFAKAEEIPPPPMKVEVVSPKE